MDSQSKQTLLIDFQDSHGTLPRWESETAKKWREKINKKSGKEPQTMAYLKSPTTADLRGMDDLKRAELAASWRTISQHLKRHRDLKLTGWETYALKRVGEMTAQQAHDELATMLRDFFIIAGENIGLEQHDYNKRKRQKEK